MKRFAIASAAVVLLASLGRAQTPPDYAKQIQPFFNKYCTECHNAKKPRAGLNLETYKGLTAGSDNGSVLVPGQADKSKLVILVEGKAKPKMPPKKVEVRPKSQEIALLRAWVNSGAKGAAAIKVVLPTIKAKTKRASPITALAWLYGGKRLLVGGYQRLSLFDADVRDCLGNLAVPGTVTALAIDRREQTLGVGCSVSGAASQIRLYAVPKIDTLWQKPRIIANAHSDAIQRLALSPDGKSLISCSYDRHVKIWNPANGGLRGDFKEHSDAVYGLAVRPDGKLFATCAADRALKVWRTATGKLLYTLGESTDWLYAAAWHPDGDHLAAAGVDKSIRVWRVDAEGGKIVHSVFAHQAPVLQLAYSPDGKTLWSLSEDRTLKVWDAESMAEKKQFGEFDDTPLSLALHPGGKVVAVGLYDGSLLLIDAKTGKVRSRRPIGGRRLLQSTKKPGPVTEKEPNNSPGTGSPISLPIEIKGTLNKAGDMDFFRFQAKAGQELGVQVIPARTKGKQTFEPVLQLSDERGTALVQSNDGYLGWTFSKAGRYAIGVRDREFGGNGSMKYTLKLGKIPVVTDVFPLGIQRGTKTRIQVEGVYLGQENFADVSADAKARPGEKIAVKLKSLSRTPLGGKTIVVGEFPEVIEKSEKRPRIPVPGTANGRISRAKESDLWHFRAEKGRRLILEVDARRLGSDLDSFIEIMDTKGIPVARAKLRSLAKTYVTFRNHNSVQPNIRIEAWTELAVNDYIWVGNELLRIRRLPTHPDSDCVFFSRKGRRTGFLDTTPTYHYNGEPMYKVAIHPPNTEFPPNGFPVVTINYRNDDGPAGFGRDSRLVFDPPADGEYQVRIGDTRNRGGRNFAYRLTVRRPRPNYTVSFSPTSPSVWQGGAIPITVTANRIDEFDGPIRLRLENLPPGFSAPETTIPAGEENTVFALWADMDAKTPKRGSKLKLIAEGDIGGKMVRREVTGGLPKAVPPGDIVTTTEKSAVALTPGGRTTLTVHVERRNKFKGRIPLDVQGMPHGVKVLDLGLNGILITEKETKRTIVFYCHPWVQPMEHPIVVTARREGRNTRHSARSVILKVVRPK